MILQYTLQPPNNTRLANVCGPADQHLRTIEVATQTSITRREGNFKVEGTKAGAQKAMEVIQAMYEIANRDITAEHLHLMLAGDSPFAEDANGVAR